MLEYNLAFSCVNGKSCTNRLTVTTAYSLSKIVMNKSIVVVETLIEFRDSHAIRLEDKSFMVSRGEIVELQPAVLSLGHCSCANCWLSRLEWIF